MGEPVQSQEVVISAGLDGADKVMQLEALVAPKLALEFVLADELLRRFFERLLEVAQVPEGRAQS
eukprot:2249765-Alexandrium_andersonii.AAC.1